MAVSTVVAPLSPRIPGITKEAVEALIGIETISLRSTEIYSETKQNKDTAEQSAPSDSSSSSTANSSLDNELIHVETTRYGGRGYFASVDIPANTTVLSEPSPFAATIFRQYKKDTCANCFKCDFHKACKIKIDSPAISPLLTDLLANKKLKAARSNKQAYAGLFFCTETCRDDWTATQDSFGALGLLLNLIDQAVASAKAPAPDSDDDAVAQSPVVIDNAYIDSYWAENISTPSKQTIPYLDTAEHDTARIVAVVIAKAYLVDSIPDLTQHYRKAFQTFNELQSNEQQLISAFPDLIASHVKVYQFLTVALKKTPFAKHLTPELFRGVIGKEAGNAFGIWQFPVFLESECLGSSVYPAPSFFNHACAHSVQKRRTGRGMDFVTTRDIAKGEELYISYGMFEDLPVKERQETLLQQWHFKCACPKCDRELKQL